MAKELAGLTPGLVGADIQHVCSVAALIAARRGADAVAMQDLSNAVDR
jgi:ATP-dependent Zn protease